MKNVLLIILSIYILVVIVILLFYFQSKNSGKGTLQVTATPKSKVYLDDKLLGETPLCQCKDKYVKEGKHTLKIVPNDQSLLPFEANIEIEPSAMTVVDRTFGNAGLSEGSIMTLKPLDDKNKTTLQIVSSPPSSDILIDNVNVGTTPLIIAAITPDSDHEITIRKTGYKEKILRIHTWLGHSLESRVDLAIDPTQEISPTPIASPEASLTPQPTISTPQVTILNTPTGFLRVHSDSSIGSEEIGKVNPGEIFDLLNEKNGWYEIKMTDGKTGWISTSYAKKNS